MERRIININDCADYLGLSKATLYVWVCRRKIPYLKVGKLVKFDLRVIEDWIKTNSVAKLN